jgi:hypothetical protein
VLQNRAGRFEEPVAEVEAHLWEVENLERTGLWRDVREMAELPARLAHWWKRLRPAQRTPPLQTRYDAARAHLAEMNRRRLQEQLRQQTGAVQRMTTQPAGGKEISMGLLSSGEIQAKLTVNPPADVYEREAHQVAQEVMRVPEPQVQRQQDLEQEEEEILQAKPLTGEATPLAQRQVGHAFGDSGHSRVRSPAAELITSSAGLRRRVQRQAGRARPTSPLLPEIWNRLAKWVKQDQPDRPADLTRMPALRGILLALYARVGLALWRHIRQITWVGPRGAMEFHPVDEGALKATLIGRGYTTSYFAKGGTDRWGLREKNVDAAGLHWRGRPGGKVNVHIDLHPPSWTGFWHWLMDSGRIRSMTHTREAIRAGIASLGIYIPVIHEQRAHGRLTVRLNKLDNQARGRPDVQAEVDEGRRHLRQASSIIWTKSVVSQAELNNAIWYLDLAAACASGAEHSLRSAGR